MPTSTRQTAPAPATAPNRRILVSTAALVLALGAVDGCAAKRPAVATARPKPPPTNRTERS